MSPAPCGPAPAPRYGYAAASMLECVANVSEGCRTSLVDAMAEAVGAGLLDVHSDCYHNRSVLTFAGQPAEVQAAARALAGQVLATLDIRAHEGAHPRLGTLDVVPFVPLVPAAEVAGDLLDAGPGRDQDAVSERGSFARWAGAELGLPTFLYGPDRSLPEVRRRAWRDLWPDFGPRRPHPTAGAVAVGYRPAMIAYNLWLAYPDLAEARRLAGALRSPAVRALALQLGEHVQLSFNLVKPFEVGPAEIVAMATAAGAVIARAELVGLLPRRVLDRAPEADWARLGLSLDQTIEARTGL